MKFVLQTLFENKYKNYQYICLEEFEDTKGVTRIHISKKNTYNAMAEKETKEQSTIYKTPHRKLNTSLVKIRQELVLEWFLPKQKCI